MPSSLKEGVAEGEVDEALGQEDGHVMMDGDLSFSLAADRNVSFSTEV